MLSQFFPVVSKDLNLVLNMDIKGIICIKVVNSSMETCSSYRGISVKLKSFSVVFLTQNSINQKALHTDYKQTEIPNLISDSCLNGGMTSCLMYTVF